LLPLSGLKLGYLAAFLRLRNRDSLLDTVTQYQELGHHPTCRIAFRDLSTRFIFESSASSASRRLSHTFWIIISTRPPLRCPALSLSRISLYNLRHLGGCATIPAAFLTKLEDKANTEAGNFFIL
jgi:hypothetical protein